MLSVDQLTALLDMLNKALYPPKAFHGISTKIKCVTPAKNVTVYTAAAAGGKFACI